MIIKINWIYNIKDTVKDLTKIKIRFLYIFSYYVNKVKG